MVAIVKRIAVSTGATVATIVALMALALAVANLVFGMGMTGAVALYFVVWWIMLFAVLPFGVRSQIEAGEVVAGSEPGAPARPALREKAIWTSIVAGFVFNLAAALLPFAGLG